MGDRIKHLRKAKGLTIEQLGRKVDRTRTAVWKWENGDTKDLKNECLALVCIALGTDLPYLIWGDDRRPPHTRATSAPKGKREKGS